jgi:hypothetical protein
MTGRRLLHLHASSRLKRLFRFRHRRGAVDVLGELVSNDGNKRAFGKLRREY